MTKHFTIFLGLLLGGVFLYFAFYGVRFDQLWLTVQQLKVGFLVAAVPFIAAEYILRAYRWKLLLDRESGPKFHQLFSVLMIGYLSNIVIPLRMGELIRAQFLGSNYRINRMRGLATIVVERVFDVLMLALLFGFCVLLHDAFPTWVKNGGFLAGAAVAGVLPLLYFCANRRVRVVDCVRSLLDRARLGEKISRLIDNFSLGLTALNEFRNVLAVVGLSVLIWLTMIGSVIMVLLAFPFTVSLLAGAFVIVLLSLSMLLPTPPGNIGVYETFAVLAVLPFGIEREAALGFALVLHCVELAVTFSIGLACFVREVSSTEGVPVKLWPGQQPLAIRTKK